MDDRYLNETPPAASEEGKCFRFLKIFLFAIFMLFICLMIIAIGYFYGWSEWKKSMIEQREYSLLQTNEKLKEENKKLKIEIEDGKKKTEDLIRQEQIESEKLLQKERLDWEREKVHMRNYGSGNRYYYYYHPPRRRHPRTPRGVRVRYKKD